MAKKQAFPTFNNMQNPEVITSNISSVAQEKVFKSKGDEIIA